MFKNIIFVLNRTDPRCPSCRIKISDAMVNCNSKFYHVDKVILWC